MADKAKLGEGKSASSTTESDKLSRPEKLVVFPDAPCSSEVFTRQAETIVNIVMNADAEFGFTIGLLGPWGSGKTSVLRSIEKSLTDGLDDGAGPGVGAKVHRLLRSAPDADGSGSAEAVDPRSLLAVARFEAWRYSDSPELMAGLLDAIAASVKRNQFGERLEQLLSVASRLASLAFAVMGSMAPVDPGILDAAKEVLRDKPDAAAGDEKRPIKQLYYQTLDEIADELAEKDPSPTGDGEVLKRRIVVLVDDLDRCTPETVANLLEGVNTLVGCRRFFFVLAFDRDYLVDVINQKYRPKNDTDDACFADRFMEKLIQIPVQIPSLSVSLEQIGETKGLLR